MSSKQTSKLFLLGVIAISLHFTVRFGMEAWRYYSLSASSQAKVTEWEIIPINAKYALKASYEFDSQKKLCHSISILPPPYYLNEFSALSALKKRAEKGEIAWFNPNQPEQAELEKVFPWGLLSRMSICYGVLIYFFYLFKRRIVV